jgi:hypothetical protein
VTLWLAQHRNDPEDFWRSTTGIPFNDEIPGGPEFVEATHDLTKVLNKEAGYERFRFLKLEEGDDGRFRLTPN